MLVLSISSFLVACKTYSSTAFLNSSLTNFSVKLVNSEEFDGLSSEEAKVKIVEKLEKIGKGRYKTNYRLRDWSVARQRYWGHHHSNEIVDNEAYNNWNPQKCP